MDDVDTYLQALATVNHRGFGFLAAYGTTWLVSGVLWRVWGTKVGSYAALFQGMVALPLALGLTALSASGPRPHHPTLDQLAIYLSTGQLLMLPLAIVLVVRRQQLLAVAAIATTTAVHFVPYSWLYSTPVYLVMGALVAVLVVVVVGRSTEREQDAGAQICAGTSGILLLGAVVAVLL